MDAVIVTKDLNNKVEVRQPLEVGAGRGAAFGALIGGATGAALAAELPKTDVKALALHDLKPGESTLAVYIHEIWIDQVQQAAEDFDATVHHQIVANQRKAEREERAARRA